MEATCNCGTIKVKVNDPDLFTKRRGHICHCQNCRKTAGSGESFLPILLIPPFLLITTHEVYGANLVIESEKVIISGDENLTEYKDFDTLSGNPVSRYFCKTCGK